ncbi:MAG: hypothetical protein L0177_10140 [Chloroflexi bacterium]|nr:hypothetical protein [Chloroflexota bacterium]
MPDRVLTDFEGNEIRFLEERQRHVRRKHPRIYRIPGAIELTLAEPEDWGPSLISPRVRVYERHFDTVNSGRWLVRVVVDFGVRSPYIRTATIHGANG